jgi:hypothetical protein
MVEERRFSVALGYKKMRASASMVSVTKSTRIDAHNRTAIQFSIRISHRNTPQNPVWPPISTAFIFRLDHPAFTKDTPYK